MQTPKIVQFREDFVRLPYVPYLPLVPYVLLVAPRRRIDLGVRSRSPQTGLVPPRVPTVAPASATAISPVPPPTSATAATMPSAPATTSAAILITAAAPATPAAKAALLARPRFVDAKRASLDLLAIELAYGVLSVGLGSHGHKSESPGLAREFILHEQHFGHSTSLRKHVLQLQFSRRERQVAYVQSISHIICIFASEASASPAGSTALKRLQ